MRPRAIPPTRRSLARLTAHLITAWRQSPSQLRDAASPTPVKHVHQATGSNYHPHYGCRGGRRRGRGLHSPAGCSQAGLKGSPGGKPQGQTGSVERRGRGDTYLEDGMSLAGVLARHLPGAAGVYADLLSGFGMCLVARTSSIERRMHCSDLPGRDATPLPSPRPRDIYTEGKRETTRP